MSPSELCVGKTIASLKHDSHYYGYPFEDQGDVGGTLLIFTFTDESIAVYATATRDNGDGSSSVLTEWFDNVEDAKDTKWLGSEDDCSEDEE